MQREIALPGNRRRYVDVRRLLRPQPIPQRVEDLSLGEAPGSGCVVGSQILSASLEWPDLKLAYQCVPHTIQPPNPSRIRIAATMASAARVRQDDKPAVRYLILRRLTGLHVTAAHVRRRRSRASSHDE